MRAHSTELKLSAVAQSVTCSIGVAQAQSQPSFSYCHNNKVNAYTSSGSGLPETVRYLVDGNFATRMTTYADNVYVDFTLAPQYVGKTLTKFAYWYTITNLNWSGLGRKVKTFDLYYRTGSACVFYKTVTSVVTALGSTVEEWDIDMPCPTGRVKVVVGKNMMWAPMVGDQDRYGAEIAFGCWT